VGGKKDERGKHGPVKIPGVNPETTEYEDADGEGVTGTKGSRPAKKKER